jgi:hypothetical protein
MELSSSSGGGPFQLDGEASWRARSSLRGAVDQIKYLTYLTSSHQKSSLVEIQSDLNSSKASSYIFQHEDNKATWRSL